MARTGFFAIRLLDNFVRIISGVSACRCLVSCCVPPEFSEKGDRVLALMSVPA